MFLPFFTTILLSLLLEAHSQLNLTLTSTRLLINQTNSFNIQNISAVDSCGRMVSTNNYLYHLSTEEVWQSWLTPTSNLLTGTLDYSIDPSNTIKDFDVTTTDDQLFLLNPTNNLKTIIVFNLTNGSPLLFQYISNPRVQVPTHIFTLNNSILLYYQSGSAAVDFFQVQDINAQTTSTYLTTHSNASIVLTPDKKKALTWIANAKVYIYNTSNLALLFTFTDSIMGTSYSTNTITFSPDSTLAFIEADQFANVRVLNLTGFTVYRYYITAVSIQNSVFLSNDIILVFTLNGPIIWDLTNNTLQQPTQFALPFTTLAYDSTNSKLYLCQNNFISIYSISFPPLSGAASNNSNTTIPIPILNLTNITSYEDETSEFYRKIILTQKQAQIYDNLQVVLFKATEFIFQKIVILASSTPFAFYLLSFLNFLNISCLYILSHISIPKIVYDNLGAIYISISVSILQLFGIDPDLNNITAERVNCDKLLYFGVSSDILSNDSLTFVLVFFNVIIARLVKSISIRMQRGKIMQRLLSKARYEIVYGQMIELLIPLTLPWTYVYMGGSSEGRNKVNLCLQYILFFFCLLFPFVYLLRLIQARRKMLIKLYYRPFYITQQINIKLIEEYHACLSNFIYPLLIVLKNPLPFLTIISLYTLSSSYIAWKKRYWLNSFILTLYPIIYHTCFIIFYSVQNDNILACTGILLLCIILAGSFHHIFTIIITSACFLHSLTKTILATNRISPVTVKKLSHAKSVNNSHVSYQSSTRAKKISPGMQFKIEYIQKSPPILSMAKSYKSAKRQKNNGKNMQVVMFEDRLCDNPVVTLRYGHRNDFAPTARRRWCQQE